MGERNEIFDHVPCLEYVHAVLYK